MRTSRWALMSVLLLAGPIHAAESAAMTKIMRFQLFNHCAPMKPLVESLPPEAASIGLTKEALEAALESRLRAAKLYDGKDGARTPYLYLHISMKDEAFSTELRYFRYVCDMLTGNCGQAATWSAGAVGTYSSGGFIHTAVTQHIDTFLAEYLQRNKASCGN